MYLQVFVCLFFSFAYSGSSSKLHTVYKFQNVVQEDDPLASIDSGVKEINKKLDSALDILTRNSTKIGICTKNYNGTSKPTSCADLRLGGATCDGVYEIFLEKLQGRSVKVVCDMSTDGGGWTVFLRRGNYSNRMASFQKSWGNFKNGFGDADGEFWLGNQVIYLMTDEDYHDHTQLRIHLTAFDLDEIYLDYARFQLGPESYYYNIYIETPINVPPPLEAVAKSLIDGYGFDFVTYDGCIPNDQRVCGAACRCGWWFNKDSSIQLTGQYFPEGYHKDQNRGILWKSWKGNDSLKAAEMMFRPANFQPVS